MISSGRGTRPRGPRWQSRLAVSPSPSLMDVAGWTWLGGLGEPVSAAGALWPLVSAMLARGDASGAVALVEDVRPFFETRPGLGTHEIAAAAAAVAAAPLAVEPSEAVGALELAVAEAAAAGLTALPAP